MRGFRCSLGVALAACAIASAAQAQETLARPGIHVRVVPLTASTAVLQGTLVRLDGDSVVLLVTPPSVDPRTLPDSSVAVPLADVAAVDVLTGHRRYVLKGAVTGAAIGAAAAYVLSVGTLGILPRDDRALAVVALAGAFVGGSVGRQGTEVWQPVPIRSVRPIVSPRALGISIRLR